MCSIHKYAGRSGGRGLPLLATCVLTRSRSSWFPHVFVFGNEFELNEVHSRFIMNEISTGFRATRSDGTKIELITRSALTTLNIYRNIKFIRARYLVKDTGFFRNAINNV